MLVLYAEDDLEDFETFIEVLKMVDPSIEYTHARHGIDVLEILDSSVALPDYIFLDINMPVMDGRACLKEIKKDKRFNSIPVIIYTTSNNPMDKELCLELGAFAYLIKPNSFNDAVNSLKALLKQG